MAKQSAWKSLWSGDKKPLIISAAVLIGLIIFFKIQTSGQQP